MRKFEIPITETMKRITILLSLSILSLLGCEKVDKNTGSGWGRVLQINSNTPVPNALVIFYKPILNNSWAGNQNEEVWRDTTDVNGVFEVPGHVHFMSARAFGFSHLFADPSPTTQAGIIHQNGEEVLYLFLRPRAWLKIVPVDEPPLNVEVMQVEVTIHNSPELIPITTGKVYQFSGNTSPPTQYRLLIRESDNSFSWTDRVSLTIPLLTPFDTTHVEIKF